MWAWTPAFVAAVFAVSGADSVRATELASYVSAAFHVMGLVASSSMGRLSDGLGRRIVLVGLSATGALRTLALGRLIGPRGPVTGAGCWVPALSRLGGSARSWPAPTEPAAP